MPVDDSILGCSVRGASHIRHGTPMEDYSAVERFWRSGVRSSVPTAPVRREADEPDALLMAVSDGHGDPRCMRSRLGSEMAVKTALCAMRDFLESLEANEIPAFLDDPQESIDRIAAQIAQDWRHLALCDLDERPLDEHEREQAADLLAVYESGQRREHIYGATLIAGMLTADFLLLLQKGDGHAVLIDETGGTDANVIPWDERCEGNVTTSLCDADAAKTFCSRLIDLRTQKPGLAAVFLGTDGVEDSYADMEGVCAYYSDLAARCARGGVQNVQNGLEEELSQMSRLGSHDDVSLTGFLRLPRLIPLADRLEARMHRYNARTAYEHHSGRLLSMTRRREKAERDAKRAQAALEAAEREQMRQEQELQRLKTEGEAPDAQPIRALREREQTLDRQLQQMEEENQRFNERSRQATNELYEVLERIRTELIRCGRIQAVCLNGSPFEALEAEAKERAFRYEAACEQRRAVQQEIARLTQEHEQRAETRRQQIAQRERALEAARESTQKAQDAMQSVSEANKAFWAEYGEIERIAQEAKKRMEQADPPISAGAGHEVESQAQA